MRYLTIEKIYNRLFGLLQRKKKRHLLLREIFFDLAYLRTGKGNCSELLFAIESIPAISINSGKSSGQLSKNFIDNLTVEIDLDTKERKGYCQFSYNEDVKLNDTSCKILIFRI